MTNSWKENSLLNDINSMRERLDRFIRNNLFSKFSDYREPFIDFDETDQEYILKVEIPGVTKEDIEIYPTSNGISIKAEKKTEMKQQDEEKGFYQKEQRYAGFYENISLSEEVDKDNIDAKYNNGVLELRIPKKESSKKAKVNVK